METFYVGFFRSLTGIAVDCRRLPSVAVGCSRLPSAGVMVSVDHCRRLPSVGVLHRRIVDLYGFGSFAPPVSFSVSFSPSSFSLPPCFFRNLRQDSIRKSFGFRRSAVFSRLQTSLDSGWVLIVSLPCCMCASVSQPRFVQVCLCCVRPRLPGMGVVSL